MNAEEKRRLLICNDLGISPEDLSLEPSENDLKMNTLLKPENTASPDMNMRKKRNMLSFMSF